MIRRFSFALIAVAVGLVTLGAAWAQGNTSGRTRTQTYQPGEPFTGAPGGAPGRTTGRTGTQSPFNLPPLISQVPPLPAPSAAPAMPPTGYSEAEIFDRIIEFWSAVFASCPGFGAFVPPLALQGVTNLHVSAAYVDSLSTDPRVAGHHEEVLFHPVRLYTLSPGTTLAESHLGVAVPGHFRAEVTLAHEVGHRVQDLLHTHHTPGDPPWTPADNRRHEQEADYFSGAYLFWLQQQGRLPVGMVTAGAKSRRAAGDENQAPPTARTSLRSHGTAAERSQAFLAGAINGLPGDFCTTRVAITAVP